MNRILVAYDGSEPAKEAMNLRLNLPVIITVNCTLLPFASCRSLVASWRCRILLAGHNRILTR